MTARRLVLLLVICGCNAITGIGGYVNVDDTDATTSDAGDGGSLAEASACSDCIDAATQCGSQCATDRMTCLAACGSPPCKTKCENTFTSCQQKCVSSCGSCLEAGACTTLPSCSAAVGD